MIFADLLEGLASPTVLCRIVEKMSPEMFVGVLFAFHETKVEQGEIIGQLIDDVFLVVTKGVVGSCELAVFEVFKHLGEESVVFQLGFVDNL